MPEVFDKAVKIGKRYVESLSFHRSKVGRLEKSLANGLDYANGLKGQEGYDDAVDYMSDMSEKVREAIRSGDNRKMSVALKDLKGQEDGKGGIENAFQAIGDYYSGMTASGDRKVGTAVSRITTSGVMGFAAVDSVSMMTGHGNIIGGDPY